jgi:maltooligosyltrehalose trehalohydrolase
MAPFEVWAPRAARVELLLDGERLTMEPGERGWWRLQRSAPPGSDYGFVLDGGEPLPDPRSPWQPHGVHGLSRTTDHADFRWTDAGWAQRPLREAIIYELHVGTFTPDGTFVAAIEKLPHLVELGVTHVELMPVAQFSGERGWGYDGVDLFAPHEAYGGPEALKRLVDAAHRLGLGVLLDVVYNHLGPEGNYLARFGPYFTDRYRTPWGDAVNFHEGGSDEVRAFVVDSALTWLRDYHVDGLRLDAMHAVYDASPVHIGAEIARAVGRLAREIGRPLVVTVESDANDPRLLRDPASGGDGLDAVWADDVHHALHATLTGERAGYYRDFPGLDALADVIREPFLRPGAYRGYRDRSHGGSPDGLAGDRFVACLQNHDQVGNRARGERIGQLVGPARQMVGAAVLLTAPYVPLLFAGEEWGAGTPFPFFSDHRDPGLGEAVRRGRRAEFAAFGWAPDQIPDPQAPETFAAARLDWAEAERPIHAATLAWYRSLIALRHDRSALATEDRTASAVAHDADAGTLRVERAGLCLDANLGSVPTRLAARGPLLLASSPDVRLDGGVLVLPPDTVSICDVTR